ncbi:hypothetical protein ACQY0O_005139 [Thecaphora frezii]
MATTASTQPPPTDALDTIALNTITLDTPDSDSDSQDFHDAPSSHPLPTSHPSRPEPSRNHDNDNHNHNQEDDDLPPAFPSLNSAQRSAPSLQPPSSEKPTAASVLQFITSTSNPAQTAAEKKDKSLMPPPSSLGSLGVPRNGLTPGGGGGGGGGGLAVPPTTTAASAPPGVGGASGASLAGQGGKRKKVALAPGCSPLDWARLKSSTDLRGGVTQLLRITPSELKRHNQRHDAWSAFYGKVYNLTPYLRFHPGGEDDLMRVAGRDGTRLFALTHSWVNIDAMIDSAMVGVLVSE